MLRVILLVAAICVSALAAPLFDIDVDNTNILAGEMDVSVSEKSLTLNFDKDFATNSQGVHVEIDITADQVKTRQSGGDANLIGGRTLIDEADVLPDELTDYLSYLENVSTGDDWEKWVVGDIRYSTNEIANDKKILEMASKIIQGLDFPPEISFDEIHAIFNPFLLLRFTTSATILKTRLETKPILFANDWWKFQARAKEREVVLENYRKLVAKWEWNIGMTIPVVPVVHGVNFKAGFGVAATGFTSLASFEEGFYGEGICFQTSGTRSLPYYGERVDPGIVVSLLIPGHVFPVVENPDEPDNLYEKAIHAGFNSHFISVDGDGIIRTPEKNIYHDFVIDNEPLSVPIFILRPSTGKVLKEVTQRFQQFHGVDWDETSQTDTYVEPVVDNSNKPKPKVSVD